MDETRVDEVMPEVMVTAALSVHNFGPWVADEKVLLQKLRLEREQAQRSANAVSV